MNQSNFGKPVNQALLAVLNKLKDVREHGYEPNQYNARCPAHADSNPSLSVGLGENGQVLLYCHRGCSLDEILKGLDIEESELYQVGLSTRTPAERAQYAIRHTPRRRRPPSADWEAANSKFVGALSNEKCEKLAAELGVPAASLRAIDAGWDNETGCYTFPERDGRGQIVGISQRFAGGRKSSAPGGQRGLCIPSGFSNKPGPIVVVEGASDVAAGHALGWAVVGRPGVVGGIHELLDLLNDDQRPVQVMGENDQKDDGSWPGKTGAERTAKQLSNAIGETVKVVMPPPSAKDLREWYQQKQQGTSNESK